MPTQELPPDSQHCQPSVSLKLSARDGYGSLNRSKITASLPSRGCPFINSPWLAKMRSPSATSSGPTVNMMMRCDFPMCDMLVPFTRALGAATRCHSEERRLSIPKATSVWLPVRRFARLDPQRSQPYRVTAMVSAESLEPVGACGWRPPARRRGDRRECRNDREGASGATLALLRTKSTLDRTRFRRHVLTFGFD